MDASEAHGLFQFMSPLGGNAETSESEDDSFDLFDTRKGKRDRHQFDLTIHKQTYRAKQVHPGDFLISLQNKNFPDWFGEKHGPNQVRQCIDYLYYHQRYAETLALCQAFIQEAQTGNHSLHAHTHYYEQALTAGECALKLGDLEAAHQYAQLPKVTQDPGLAYSRANLFLACRVHQEAVHLYQYFLSQRKNDYNVWHLMGLALVFWVIDIGIENNTGSTFVQERTRPDVDEPHVYFRGSGHPQCDTPGLPFKLELPNRSTFPVANLTAELRALLGFTTLLALQCLYKGQYILQHTRWPWARAPEYLRTSMERRFAALETTHTRIGEFYTQCLLEIGDDELTLPVLKEPIDLEAHFAALHRILDKDSTLSTSSGPSPMAAAHDQCFQTLLTRVVEAQIATSSLVNQLKETLVTYRRYWESELICPNSTSDSHLVENDEAINNSSSRML
ncbi:hypothetical protein IWQ62_001732 [Dispira parvispora]|uniref:Uncharacterized protein n=1 Tax=Dispira parvispora TaxID=1520584 RepID=A0A9W8AXN9_9FUNG|nr:hypothetical protein IWQ62_001732 [Dispira parvispora]